MRDRLVIGILVGMLIILFGIVFAILGSGEYEPPAPEGQVQITELARSL